MGQFNAASVLDHWVVAGTATILQLLSLILKLVIQADIHVYFYFSPQKGRPTSVSSRTFKWKTLYPYVLLPQVLTYTVLKIKTIKHNLKDVLQIYKQSPSHYVLWKCRTVSNCKHPHWTFLRTQLSLKLHLSFNHKNMTNCVSPILPYVMLRLILHSAPCCVKLQRVQGCAPELPLKSPPDWTNTLAAVVVWKYAAMRIPVLVFSEHLFRERQVSLHSFPLMLR